MKKLIIILGLVIVSGSLLIWILFFNNFLFTGTTSRPDTLPQPDSRDTQTDVIAENLDTPWAMVFLPDKSILVTERPGRVRLIDRNMKLQPNPVANLNNVREMGEGGLMGITIHPNFQANNYIYLYYTYSGNGDNTLNRVARMTYQNNELTDEQVIVDAIPGASNHNGGRIKFGPDGYLYITTGDAQNPSQAQDRNSLGGKILRVTDEGKPAPGNPFNNLVYSYGHRNPQGLAWDNQGRLWVTEHGPSGIWPNCCRDELNLIQRGGNYGWPDSVGDQVQPNTVAPALHSDRDIWAPGGAAFLGKALFFGGLRGQALYEADINTSEITLREFYKEEFGRIREVVLGPDNLLYLTTSNRDGRGSPAASDDKVIRIDPTKLSSQNL